MQDRFGVDPGVITGIWGLESSFGAGMGDFHVVEALATLAWEGRRASFFRGELIAALRILDHGDVTPARMLGSYAGAMGQPQFMPSSYLRYAVDFEGHGRRDIWTSKPDVLGSIAQLPGAVRLAQRRAVGPAGGRWPANFERTAAGRDNRRPVGEWARLGVRPADGRPLARADAPAAVLLPDGAGGEAFLVYANFTAIRRYNPSDFYALAVGLLGRYAWSPREAGVRSAAGACSRRPATRRRRPIRITCSARPTRPAASGTIRARATKARRPGSRWSTRRAMRS